MSNFDKHVLAFICFGPIQRLQSIRKIINFWYTFGWKWWVISFRDYLGLPKACSYDVDDVIGQVDPFGFQNFCGPDTKPCPCPILGHYISNLNPSTVSAETASVVSPYQVAIVLGKKENFSSSVYAFGRWCWKGWDLVLLLPPASDRFLFLPVLSD